MSSLPYPQYPDYHHGHRSSSSRWMTNRLETRTNRKSHFADEYSLVDETPEFHDPYSDMNLFLSQKIRVEMRKEGILKKWSLKIQEILLEKIVPEFQKKFPHYRLGVSALRKSWEKIAYYTQQVEAQNGATDEKGNLRIPFLIGENLRQYPLHGSMAGFQPYHFAHQLGTKISECVAIVDGIKPSLDQLTRLIWSMQRNLLSWQILQETNSPYDEYDRLDKQIVRTLLEVKTEEPHLTAQQLETRVAENFASLSDTPAFTSQESLLSLIASLVAEKLYPTSRLHTAFLPQAKTTLLRFIERHVDLCLENTPKMLLGDAVRRILSLYLLATQIPKELPEHDLRQSFETVYNHLQQAKPASEQALFAFISAEILIKQGKGQIHSTLPAEEIYAHVRDAYLEATQLPIFEPDEVEILEIAVWRRISEKERLLTSLPFRAGQKIEAEIALQLIDDPSQNFSSLVHHTYHAFHKIRDVITTQRPNEVARKIQLWCAQGDLLYRSIRFDRDMPLMRLIHKMASRIHVTAGRFFHRDFVSKVCEIYLQQHPELSCYAGQLYARAFNLYKYSWFTHFSKENETAIDRFIAWHAITFEFSQGNAAFIAFMKNMFSEQFPFLPFEAKWCERISHFSLTQVLLG